MNYGGVDHTGRASVWVADLSFVTFVSLVRVFVRHGRFDLRFMAASRVGLAVVGLLKAAGIVGSARRVEFERVGSRVDDPQSPRLAVAVGIPDAFDAKFFATHEAVVAELVYPDPRVLRERVVLNLRKAAAETTERVMDLVELARYWDRLERIPGRRLVIVSPVAVLANSIPSAWAAQDVEFVCPWNRQHSLLLKLGRGVFRCLLGLGRRQRCASSPASVAAPAAWGLDRSARLNDLFWWWDSEIPSERVILYFEGDQKITGEIVGQTERLGIKCVALDRRAVGDSPHLLWRPAPGSRRALKRLWWDLRVCAWGIRRGAVGRWVACRLLDMLHRSQPMEDFLRTFNVRAVFHTQDKSIDHISLACDAAGAARVGHQWSHFAWPQVAVARLHQVYFAWGKQYVRMNEAVRSCVDHILLSGCIVRGAHPGASEEGDGPRARALVKAHGASRVLALFDTSVPCERFYEFFLQRVIEDSRWGLLLKTKNGLVDRPWLCGRRPDLESLQRQAMATGRVQMLDWRSSPAQAARAADFSVGVDLNSAVVVAALAGQKGIHLDYLRVDASPLAPWAFFHRAGRDRLVFHDPERLWEHLNRYFDEPGFNPTLGVADEQVLQDIDPFRDGQAGARIGEYLHWYLEDLDRGLERDVALAHASRRYVEKWGAQAVIRGLGRGSQGVSPSNLAEERSLPLGVVTGSARE